MVTYLDSKFLDIPLNGQGSDVSQGSVTILVPFFGVLEVDYADNQH